MRWQELFVSAGLLQPLHRSREALLNPCIIHHHEDERNPRQKRYTRTRILRQWATVFLHGIYTSCCRGFGHDLVTNPTCLQPGFNLPRCQFVTLNRLRCGQARCAESLHRWGVIASPACPCREGHQTTRHIVEECPLTAFPGGLQHLHQAGPDAVEWLSKLSVKL